MSLNERILAFLDSPAVRNGIIAVILLNAVVLGMETSDSIMASFGPLIVAIDTACLAVFVVELTLKLVALRLSFFRSGWNLFDFVIVGIAIVPGAGNFSVLRALRVLRLLRVISVAPALRRVVEGFVRAIPGMGSVILLMGMIFYISAVLATQLFGTGFPEWFGDLGASTYSLFQIMTLESWSMGIARPVMAQFPYAWLFFVVFILVATFTMLNLFIAIIVNAMQRYSDGDAAAQGEDGVRDELRALRAQIERLSASLAAQGGREGVSR